MYTQYLYTRKISILGVPSNLPVSHPKDAKENISLNFLGRVEWTRERIKSLLQVGVEPRSFWLTLQCLTKKPPIVENFTILKQGELSKL